MSYKFKKFDIVINDAYIDDSDPNLIIITSDAMPGTNRNVHYYTASKLKVRGSYLAITDKNERYYLNVKTAPVLLQRFAEFLI